MRLNIGGKKGCERYIVSYVLWGHIINHPPFQNITTASSSMTSTVSPLNNSNLPLKERMPRPHNLIHDKHSIDEDVIKNNPQASKTLPYIISGRYNANRTSMPPSMAPSLRLGVSIIKNIEYPARKQPMQKRIHENTKKNTQCFFSIFTSVFTID